MVPASPQFSTKAPPFRETPGSVLVRCLGLALSTIAIAVPFLVLQKLPIVALFGSWLALGLGLTVWNFARGARLSSLIALNYSLLAGLLVGAESIARGTQEEWVRDTFTAPLAQPHPELGTIPRANVTTRHRSYPLSTGYQLEWDVTYNIEEDHSRNVPDRPAAGKRLAVFGDSFMFGEGLDDADTIPNQLQNSLPQYRVFNYGVRAHGTAQNYVYLKLVLERHPDTRVCVVGFIFDHVRRTAVPHAFVALQWARGHPVVRSRNGTFVNLGSAYDTLPYYARIHVDMLSRSLVYNRLFGQWEATAEDWELVADLVSEMHERCTGEGRRFFLVCLPSAMTDDETRWTSAEFVAWKQRLRQRHVSIVDLNERFYGHLRSKDLSRADFFHPDGHPNREYARLVAIWIGQAVR